MNKLRKPIYKDLIMLLEQITVENQCTKDAAYQMLAESCGDGYEAVKKRFRNPATDRSARSCPASVWRAWCIDFRGFDPRYEEMNNEND